MRQRHYVVPMDVDQLDDADERCVLDALDRLGPLPFYRLRFVTPLPGRLAAMAAMRLLRRGALVEVAPCGRQRQTRLVRAQRPAAIVVVEMPPGDRPAPPWAS